MVDIFEIIDKSKTIALFSHLNSDGDAIGSLMAFKYYLDTLGKETYVFLQRPIGDNFYYMGINEVANIKSLSQYDLAICTDSPNSSRFGQYEQEFLKAKDSISIDHHLDNSNYAKVNIVDPSKSSTCELVYSIFKHFKKPITPQMATCLYSGLSTDTGSFTHGNMTFDTFVSAGELVNYGADLVTLNDFLYSHMKMNEFDIFRLALSKAEFYENGKIALIAISEKMLQQTNCDMTSTHEIIGQLNSIVGVEIAALITENKYRENFVSVRSKKHSAQRICLAFGGGGHLRAAGCKIFIPLKYAKQQLLDECKKELLR